MEGNLTAYTESIPYGKRVSLPSIKPIHFEKEWFEYFIFLRIFKREGLPKEFIVLWTDFHFGLVLDYRNRNENSPVMYMEENFSSSTYETTKWE